MKATKTIYLIRHGETEFNRQGIVQGSGVDSDLNETGKRQAELFFREYQHIPFDKVYTSALKRTWQSVAGFLEKGIPHEIVPELNEISWGIYEGNLPSPDWKDDYNKMIDGWKNGELHLSVPQGETPIQLNARQKKALEILLKDKDVNTALVCMHGRAMKGFLCLLLGKPLNEMEDFSHANLCLYQLEYSDRKFSLLKSNCIKHLAG